MRMTFRFFGFPLPKPGGREAARRRGPLFPLPAPAFFSFLKRGRAFFAGAFFILMYILVRPVQNGVKARSVYIISG